MIRDFQWHIHRFQRTFYEVLKIPFYFTYFLLLPAADSISLILIVCHRGSWPSTRRLFKVIPYYENEYVQMVGIPLNADTSCRMFIILPKQANRLEQCENFMTGKKVLKLLSSMWYHKVRFLLMQVERFIFLELDFRDARNLDLYCELVRSRSTTVVSHR